MNRFGRAAGSPVVHIVPLVLSLSPAPVQRALCGTACDPAPVTEGQTLLCRSCRQVA